MYHSFKILGFLIKNLQKLNVDLSLLYRSTLFTEKSVIYFVVNFLSGKSFAIILKYQLIDNYTR